MKEFTDDEKIIARNIDKEYKWMARDKNGTLCAYPINPTKREELGEWVYNNYIYVSDLFGLELFKSIKWEDDEPTLIKDIYDPQILDDAERRYLSAVTRPFRDKVLYIIKSSTSGSSKEYISIGFATFEETHLPCFKKGTMYKGMKAGKSYTVKELGL